MSKQRKEEKKKKQRQLKTQRKLSFKRRLLREERSIQRELERLKLENLEKLEPFKNENSTEISEDSQ